MCSRITIDRMLALTVAGVSVMMDLFCMRISNRWICCSLLAGFVISRMEAGRGTGEFVLGVVLPVFLLGWLFYFRMLGPGDIKLFCALGGIMGPEAVLRCIAAAFAAGAVISLGILVICGGFRERLRYLLEYLDHCRRAGRRRPYYRKGEAWENFHFTVPIFMSVLFYAGGMY